MKTNLEQLKELRYLLQLLARQFDLLLKHCSCELNINTVECTILYELNHSEKMTLSALSERISLDKSTTSRYIQRLVERGLVRRTQDLVDRRFVLLSLTKEGHDIERNITDILMEYMKPAFQKISPDQMGSIYQDLLELVKK